MPGSRYRYGVGLAIAGAISSARAYENASRVKRRRIRKRRAYWARAHTKTAPLLRRRGVV
jgi:hypothetical protein